MSTTFESRKLAYLRNWKEVAAKAKELVRERDSEAIVYVFGSVTRGKYTGSSDIDLLVVTKKKKDLEYSIKTHVYGKMLDVPLEIHVSTPEELERWYLRFIPAQELQEV